MEFPIDHSIFPEGGRFFISEGEQDVAEMTYYLRKNTMVINHTEIDSSLRGKGIGNNLVIKGVEFAREHNLKILPLCSYADHVIKRNPDFHDIL